MATKSIIAPVEDSQDHELTKVLAWERFIKFCREMGFGQLKNVYIRGGIPVKAEKVGDEVKFV